MVKQAVKQDFRFLAAAIVSFAMLFAFIALGDDRNPASMSTLRALPLWQQGDVTAGLPLPLPTSTGQSVTMYAVLPLIKFGDCMIFRTENLPVSVALNGQTLYHTAVPPAHTTPGDEWHMIPLPKNGGGQIISITSTRIFSGASLAIKAVYLGSQYQFLRTMLRGNLVSFMVSILLVLMGLSFMLASRILFPRNLNVETPWTFAMLSIALGVWSAMQTEVPELLFGGRTALMHFFSYSPLPFAVAMGCFFLRTLPAPRWLMAAYLWLAISEILAWVVTIAGETLRFAAYVETVPQARIVLYVMLVLLLFQLPALLKDFRAYFYMLLGFICLVIMIIADIVDSYAGPYDYASNTRFGMLLMISLIALQYGAHVRDSVKLADEADVMRRLAYRDPLTGLNNRLALVRDQEELLNNPRGCVGIVQMDINSLKEVNDCCGHEEGDRLILRAAQAIRDAFDELGACYRVGGDEFVALLHANVCALTDQQCADRLARACERHNVHQAHPLSIAMGFALYNPADGHMFYDFVHDADMNMYENKREMKARLSAEPPHPHACKGHDGACAAPEAPPNSADTPPAGENAAALTTRLPIALSKGIIRLRARRRKK